MALTLLPPPGKGQVLALSLLLIALGAVYLLTVHGFVMEHVAIARELDELKRTELRFRQKAAQQSALERRKAEIEQYAQANVYFLPEDSFDLAAAALNTKLKSIVTARAKDPQRCQIISSQNNRSNQKEPYQRVTIQVRLRCDLDDLMRILYDLENATPLLFVDELNLYQQPILDAGMMMPQLGSMDVRFDLSGYIRSPGGGP